MNWFTRKDKNIQDSAKKELPSDLWKKCNCGEILYSPELESANFICHHCFALRNITNVCRKFNDS